MTTNLGRSSKLNKEYHKANKIEKRSEKSWKGERIVGKAYALKILSMWLYKKHSPQPQLQLASLFASTSSLWFLIFLKAHGIISSNGLPMWSLSGQAPLQWPRVPGSAAAMEAAMSLRGGDRSFRRPGSLFEGNLESLAPCVVCLMMRNSSLSLSLSCLESN